MKRLFGALVCVSALTAGLAFGTASASADPPCHTSFLIDPAYVACQMKAYADGQAAEAARVAALPPSHNPHNVGGGWRLSPRGNQESMFRFDVWEFTGPNALTDALAFQAAHASTLMPIDGLLTLVAVPGGYRVGTIQQIPGVASSTQ